MYKRTIKFTVFSLSIGFITWLIWAIFSTGALYELKHVDSRLLERNLSANYLFQKLVITEKSGLWDSYHVESCSFYMPNWEKAEICVRTRLYCETLSPKNTSSYIISADIFSKQFKDCFNKFKPAFGIAEYLHYSRVWFRARVMMTLIWFEGGFEGLEKKAKSIQEKQKIERWLREIIEWVQKS